MKYQIYKPFWSEKQKRWCPGVKAEEMDYSRFVYLTHCDEVTKLVNDYRAGDAEAKTRLPAVTWCGRSTTGKRLAKDMVPTQLYMCDIDHCEDPRGAYNEISKNENFNFCDLLLVHVTPSGKGLRIIAKSRNELHTLAENMQWLCEKLSLDKYGDFDSAVKDISRLSFLAKSSDILYYNPKLFDAEEFDGGIETTAAEPSKTEEKPAQALSNYDNIRKQYADIEYRGNRVADIVAKYIEVYGTPQEGERHNFYNNLVKNFRHICDNNPHKVFAVLPRFTDTDDMCMSQCQSICKTNTLSKLPKDFYFFLKDNGYYVKQAVTTKEVDDYMMSEEKEEKEVLPTFPPVFRELLKTCPKDFLFPSLQALLPIMGTLTSHIRTTYWLDQREHSTQFFTVIYAGSGMGKGFVERFIELLLKDLQLRDILSSERENLYNRIVSRNKKNDKDPDNPRVTLRIIEAKCSEADFLEKQQSNKGHHMFTFAAEMDQWRKGVRAAGGNKDDMLRIAWDNGYYGQNFKSVNTFKGRIKLYWNVLITGTRPQLEKYFENVENGLVGRCGFAEVKNQEFAKPAAWKPLSDKDMTTIKKWLSKMDAANYKEPLDKQYVEMCHEVNDEEFDNVIPWRYEFRPLQSIDLTWLKPTIDKFLNEELERSALDQDYARDSFRRRVAVRGLRLAMICTTCYSKITKTEQKTIANFVTWFMHKDLAETMSLWSEGYNEVFSKQKPKVNKQGVYDLLDNEFDKSSLYAALKRSGYLTPVRQVIYNWTKINAIEKIGKDKFKKLK